MIRMFSGTVRRRRVRHAHRCNGAHGHPTSWKCDQSSLFESSGLKADYEAALVEPWSPYLGAVLLLLAVFALMLSGETWGVFGGIRLWGDWFNHLIGLGGVLGIHAPDSPLMHRISLRTSPWCWALSPPPCCRASSASTARRCWNSSGARSAAA